MKLIKRKYVREELEAKYAARQVGFLKTEEEFNLYYKAIYRAKVWGKIVK